MDRVVEDLLGSFAGSLLLHGDLVVEVARDRLLRDLGNLVSTDAPRLDNHDPVIDAQLVFLFLEQLFEVC